MTAENGTQTCFIQYTDSTQTTSGACRTPGNVIEPAQSLITSNSFTLAVDIGLSFDSEDTQNNFYTDLTKDINQVYVAAQYATDASTIYVEQGVYEATVNTGADAIGGVLGTAAGLLLALSTL